MSRLHKKSNKYKKWIFLIAFICVCWTLFSIHSYAISDDEIKNILATFPDFFVTNNFIRDTGHSIAWAGIKGLSWLAEQCTTLYHLSLGFVDFTTYSSLNQYVGTLKGVFTAILAVSICGLGITLIIDHEKKPKILKSLFLMGIAISASSFLLVTLSTAVKKDAKEITSDEIIISDVVKSSLYDLLYIDKNCGGLGNMSRSKLSDYHYNGKVDLDKVDINEVINYDSDQITTDAAKKILSKKTLYMHSTGDDYEVYISDVYNGFGWNAGEDEDFFNEFYYRYKVDYFYIYISLIAICIVFICMSYKVIRIIFEIATGRILAVLYSANINGVQKTIKIFESIINGYIVLLLTAVLIKLFTFAQTFIKDIVPYDEYPVANCLLLLFLAFSVIDGPNIIQQITGIDAGLSSGFGKMVAAYHMMREATHAVQTAGIYHSQRELIRQGRNQQQENEVNLNSEQAGDSIPPSGASATDTQNAEDLMSESSSSNSTTCDNNDSMENADSQNNPNNENSTSGASAADTQNAEDLMSEKNLDKQELPSSEKEKKPEMVNLDPDNPSIDPGSMADEMNRALNNQHTEQDGNMNGTSGLGIQKPVEVADEWKKYNKNSFVDLVEDQRKDTFVDTQSDKK